MYNDGASFEGPLDNILSLCCVRFLRPIRGCVALSLSLSLSRSKKIFVCVVVITKFSMPCLRLDCDVFTFGFNTMDCCWSRSSPKPNRRRYRDCRVKFGVPLDQVCKKDIPGPLLVSVPKKIIF